MQAERLKNQWFICAEYPPVFGALLCLLFNGGVFFFQKVQKWVHVEQISQFCLIKNDQFKDFTDSGRYFMGFGWVK